MIALVRIVKLVPQTAYTSLVKALHNEWTYLQRITIGNSSLYEPTKKAITNDFLPALLNQPNIVENMRNQIALAIKRARLGIPYPTRSTADNYAASIYCSEVLVENLLKGVPLDIMDHQRHAINSQKSSKERQKSKEQGQLAEIKRAVNKSDAQQMDRGCKSGASLTVMPSFMDDTELSA